MAAGDQQYRSSQTHPGDPPEPAVFLARAPQEQNSMGSRKDRMKIREENGVTILDLGQVEIWDGADLALLRDTFARKCGRNGCKSLGVDMSSVKYVPSGFFGMLFDWHEMGVAIRLFTPQPRVANMLWFRQFFAEQSKGAYLLQSEPKEMLAFDDSCDWNDEEEEVWVEGPRRSVGALGNT
jgi:anti-anti-sigma regulatory factor